MRHKGNIGQTMDEKFNDTDRFPMCFPHVNKYFNPFSMPVDIKRYDQI